MINRVKCRAFKNTKQNIVFRQDRKSLTVLGIEPTLFSFRRYQDDALTNVGQHASHILVRFEKNESQSLYDFVVRLISLVS